MQFAHKLIFLKNWYSLNVRERKADKFLFSIESCLTRGPVLPELTRVNVLSIYETLPAELIPNGTDMTA